MAQISVVYSEKSDIFKKVPEPEEKAPAEKPTEEQLFTPAGKKLDELTEAEKWLFEM